MNRGLLPIKHKDHRTFDFARTFGSARAIPSEFNFDTSGIFPDQEADKLPQACTAYTINDVASNEDKLEYYDDQKFTYENTKLMLDVSGDVPVDLMTAMKSGAVYGVKSKQENAQRALTHRRGSYFIVKKNPDYFEGLISAMWLKQGGLILGTPWLILFEEINGDGIIPNFTAPSKFVSGHAWEACGVKLVGGEPRIICKSWQGTKYGNGGYCYFNRKQINDLLGVQGSGAFVQQHARPEDIQRVQMSIMETIISYLRLAIAKLLTEPKPPIVSASEIPEPEARGSLLIQWAKAIEQFENFSVAYHNPGAIRGVDGKFLKFATHEDGFNYLLNYLTRVATGKHKAYPKGGETTLLEFQSIYSPVLDHNNPQSYAQVVARELGVATDIKIKNLI